MHVTLRLTTPLWTADASKQTRRAVGTGIIGSLRWWYEAIVRGLGGWACDPTDADARCPPRNAKVTPENVSTVLCPACQLFGATGWAKTFTLFTTECTPPKLIRSTKRDRNGHTRLEYPSDAYPPTGKGKVHTTGGRLNRWGKPSAWYFDPGCYGTLALTLFPRRPGDTETLPLLLGLLEFIRRNAALGAKTGLGYGLFDWKTPPSTLPTADAWVEMLADRASTGRRGPSRRWPDLREMFFAQVSLRNDGREPKDKDEDKDKDFVNFKYDLRAAFRGSGIPAPVRHFLLGQVSRSDNQATKIKMALLPDKRTLRLWGWVPDHLPGGFSRNHAMSILHKQITGLGSVSHWREFNSKRDTKARYTDGPDYLRSLMEG